MKGLALLLVMVCIVNMDAKAMAADIEVVASYPVETDLAVPGVRTTQEVWLEMIRGARATLDFEQFYVTDGDSLRPVITALRDAAARGVKVRFLADAKFHKRYPTEVGAIADLPGVQAATIDFSKYGGIQHAKFFIADRRDSFSGSQNFDWRALTHIHEVGLRVKDEVIGGDLTRIFEKDWSQGVPVNKGATLERVAEESMKPRDSQIKVVASPLQENPARIGASLDAMLELLSAARGRLRMQVMDYSTKTHSAEYGGKPDPQASWRILDNAIRAAGKRGVKVQLLVDASHARNKPELDALARAENVEVRAVTIPEWSGGKIEYARLIHSKFIVADGERLWVGSENWSEGYFRNTRNVGFVVKSAAVASTLSQLFDKLWASPYAVSQF